MIVDCDTCIARGPACADCVVTVVLGAPDQWGVDEQRALAVLAGSGLVPPLRLVQPGDRSPEPHQPPASQHAPQPHQHRRDVG